MKSVLLAVLLLQCWLAAQVLISQIEEGKYFYPSRLDGTSMWTSAHASLGDGTLVAFTEAYPATHKCSRTEDSSWTKLTCYRKASSEPQLGEEPPAAKQTPQGMKSDRHHICQK